MACPYRNAALDASAPASAQHLEACPECRGVRTQQEAVWRMLDEWTPPPVSPGFDAALWQRLEAEPAQPWWRRWWSGHARPVLPWAAACMVLLLAVAISVARLGGRADKVDIEQVERTVEDMDLLRTLTSTATPVTPGTKGTSL